MSVRTEGNAPVKKVTMAGIGGASATIIVWILNTFVITNPEQQITGEVSAAFATVVSFVFAYFARPGANEKTIAA